MRASQTTNDDNSCVSYVNVLAHQCSVLGRLGVTSASGELVVNMFSALAQFERRLIQERTKAGLEAARARGRQGGRRRMSSDDPKVVLANKLFCDKSVSIVDICTTLKISRATQIRFATG